MECILSWLIVIVPNIMKKNLPILFFFFLTVVLNTSHAIAQSVVTTFNPSVSLNYLSTDPNAIRPTVPASDNQVYNWYATKRMGWDATSFKAYIINGMQFRLKFPKNYDPANTNVKYPMIVFFHGAGELGNVYDNEQQLYHAAQRHLRAIDNLNQFNGFLLFPQSTGTSFYGSYSSNISTLINLINTKANLDLDRITTHGLSNGSKAVVEMVRQYPKLFASALPMSTVSGWGEYEKFIHLPLWTFQGGLDRNPTPSATEQVVAEIKALGGDIKYTLYPSLGHGVWNTAYEDPDFFPFINRAHKANPLVFFGRTEFCVGDPVYVKMGLTPGFDGYEWRKDGVLLSGANSNILEVTNLGVYEARIRRGTVWSLWSPIPVNIKIKSATIPPTITVSGLRSRVIPAPDGSNNVTLQVPDIYTEYSWERVGSSTVLSTTNTLTVTQPGDYRVRIKELYGCTSNFSNSFTVVPASGANSPDAATALNAATFSRTEIQLNWSNNITPTNNETNFEIYRSATSGGVLKLVGIVNSDILSYKDQNLEPNTKYYYKIRAINNNGSAATSNEAFATTEKDITPPTTHNNLKITGISRIYADLDWNESTDDVGVYKYDIYVNDEKLYSIDPVNTSFRVNGLTFGINYKFRIVARDLSGNLSVSSNQVTATAANSGFNYKYYEIPTGTATWSILPNFNLLTPTETGVIDNISLSIAKTTERFGVVYEGFINIPVSGNYTFETNSDDGSKLYIGNYNPSATALVNNDGLHGAQFREGTINLAAGTYPFTVTFFQGTGGSGLSVYWKNTANGVGATRQLIPKEFFSDAVNPVTKPAAPSNVNAIVQNYTQIYLTWKDNSTDEQGFEIYRSENILGPFNIINRVNTNVSAYVDQSLKGNTRYFYKVKAVGSSGESLLTGKNQDLNLNFNNNLTETSGFNRSVVGNATMVYDAINKKEGTHSFKLTGSNSINIGSTTGFLHEAFNSKTISFWIKPSVLNEHRVLLDIGSNSNGLAIKVNNNILEAGIASNSIRNLLTTTVTTDWQYITFVYDRNSIYLYKNGILVASNEALTFNSVGTTTDNSRIGSVNGTYALNSVPSSSPIKANLDAFILYDNALNANEVNGLYAKVNLNANAFTGAPPAPTTPSNLYIMVVSSSKLKINYNRDINPGTEYAIYRSVSSENSFSKIFQGQNGSNASIIDSNLLAHTSYSYKLKYINSTGESPFSAAATGKTYNNKPIISDIPSRSLRIGTITEIILSATDIDNDSITFEIEDASNYDYLQIQRIDKFTSKLIVSPTNNNAGINNFTVIAKDGFGGSSSYSTEFIIDDNFVPVISTVSDISLNENTTLNVNVSATDENTDDELTYSVSPSVSNFVTIVNIDNNNATLSIKPKFADAGIYNFFLRVADYNGAIDSVPVKITVRDIDPSYKLYVNFTGSSTEGGYWNNTTSPSNGYTLSNLKSDKLINTNVDFVTTSAWPAGAANDGLFNNALFPVNVTNTNWATNNGPQTFKLKDLDPNFQYTFSFLASSKYSNGDFTSNFTINGNIVSINAYNNTNNLVTIPGIVPNAQNEIVVTVSNNTGGTAYINAMVVGVGILSNAAPAAPKNLTVVYDNTNGVKLNWSDPAFDESSFEIYRSVGNSGTYQLIATIPSNSVEYFDSNFSGNTINKYQIRSINNFGPSGYSNIANLTTPNRIPTIAVITNKLVKTGESLVFDVQINDDAGETITINASNLPAFATLTNISNGLARITISPNNSNIGNYNNITITATDSFGGVGTAIFNLRVSDSRFTAINVNINGDASSAAASPWNNFSTGLTTNASIANLKDEFSVNTGITITSLDAWGGARDWGYNSTNESGVYPDNVSKSYYFENSDNVKRFKISGLSSTKRYNLVFLSSWVNVFNTSVTRFTINGTTVSLNAVENKGNTVQINNIAADANGEILINVQRQAGTAFAILNAITIQSFTFTGQPLAPTNLAGFGKSKTSIRLDWTDQSDNESGFEISRSTTENGTYSILTTVAPNITTFNDNNLAVNTKYFYKIRATEASNNNSDYSNIAIVSTLLNTINVQFNRVNSAGTGWNSTAKNPANGDFFPNLFDTDNVNSGIAMTIVDNFDGANEIGLTSPNNSGPFPNLVNRSVYYSEKAETVRIKFSGLSRSLTYDFEFFNSWDYANQPFGNGSNTIFTINGRSVNQDPAQNIDRTVQISNVNADEAGEIFVDVFMTADRDYAILNAIILKSHAKVLSPTNTLLVTKDALNKVKSSVVNSEIVKADIVKTYPNPFTDKIFIDLREFSNLKGKGKVDLLDITGRVVKSQNLSFSTNPGIVELQVGQQNLNSGIYLIRLSGDQIKSQTFKLIKN